MGNCHKWLFAPKGCAVLYVAREHRNRIHPLVISHGYGQGLAAEFDWVGTRDPSSWLALDAALDFVTDHGGPDRIRAHNIGLRDRGAAIVAEALGVQRMAPSNLLAALETLPLVGPGGSGPREGGRPEAFELSRRVWDNHRVESMIAPFGGQLYVRVAAQLYNTEDDYRALAAALQVELA